MASRQIVNEFEGPEWVEEKLPKKIVPQLFHSDHQSAPSKEELRYVDGGPRRKRVTVRTGPSKLVEQHVHDLEYGMNIRLPNGATLRIGAAGADHIEISVTEGPDKKRSAHTINVVGSASNTVYVGCQDWVDTRRPKLEDL